MASRPRLPSLPRGWEISGRLLAAHSAKGRAWLNTCWPKFGGVQLSGQHEHKAEAQSGVARMPTNWEVTSEMRKASSACIFLLLTTSATPSFAEPSDDLPSRDQLLRMAGDARQAKLTSQLYTPILGSPERTAIMDAIRLATGWNVKFKVDHLVVARAGSKALAVANVSDASNKTESSGIFELEGLNSQWRALYSVGGGGGADECETEETVLKKMVSKAQEYANAKEILPERFWRIVQENKSATECWGTVSVEFFKSR
jgi:hypothetical protein